MRCTNGEVISATSLIKIFLGMVTLFFVVIFDSIALPPYFRNVSLFYVSHVEKSTRDEAEITSPIFN